MRNSVTISLEFYFKGKQYLPSMTLDLDSMMEKKGELPPLETLYTSLAEHNDIGLYSYEFEVMTMEPLEFSNPQGCVADYIQDGHLDNEAFERDWHQNKLNAQLAEIASKHLSIDSLEQAPDLKAALLEAYTLGSNSAKK